MRLRLWLALLVSVTVAGCNRLSPAPGVEPDTVQLAVTSPAVEPARGVFVVIHGLNLRPSAMDPLCEYLNSLGFHTHRLVLTGHGRETESREVFDADTWRDDVAKAYASVTSRYPGMPVYMLGYSIGGLLAVDAIRQREEIQPKGLVLVAPALSLRTIVEAGGLVSLLPPSTRTFPNLAREGYLRFKTTPLFWYQNTYALYGIDDDTHSERLSDIPALIFLNPRDELIAYQGTRRWVKTHGLRGVWRIETMRPQPLMSRSLQHLMVDEPSLGTHEWKRMRSVLREFLRQ